MHKFERNLPAGFYVFKQLLRACKLLIKRIELETGKGYDEIFSLSDALKCFENLSYVERCSYDVMSILTNTESCLEYHPTTRKVLFTWDYSIVSLSQEQISNALTHKEWRVKTWLDIFLSYFLVTLARRVYQDRLFVRAPQTGSKGLCQTLVLEDSQASTDAIINLGNREKSYVIKIRGTKMRHAEWRCKKHGRARAIRDFGNDSIEITNVERGYEFG
jgi:hypothetical protein